MILLSIYDLSESESKVLRYEDIIVHTYNRYPDHFHLIGYPQYPDTESISKKIYDILRPKGFITLAKRQYRLTKTGIEYAKKLAGIPILGQSAHPEFPNTYMEELERIYQLKGFNLFLKGHEDELIDQDYYDFYQISVRSDMRYVQGNIKLIGDVVRSATKNEIVNIDKIVMYKNMLDNMFGEIFQ